MDNNTTSTPIPNNTKREYTASESVFAWISLVLGYLFCRAFPAASNPMGAFLFIVLITLVTAVILALNKAPFGLISICSALSCIAFSAALIITENSFIHFFAYLYCLMAYCFFVYTAWGNYEKRTFAALFPLEWFVCLFKAPFKSFSAIGSGLSANGKINAKPILKAILGITLTIIPTYIIMLLLSYDSDFASLTEKIFAFDSLKTASHIGSILFGIPVGMYIYGLFISSADKKCKNMIDEETVKKRRLSVQILPAITALFATLPILFVYVLFFISQWKYYVSGFKGVLPDEISYASYAREGFFQLCTVAVINFIIIGFIRVFLHRKSEKPSAIERIISTLFSLSTLILISTAMAKMAMYIDIYGLTQKRVYATWFMIVLGVLFVLILIEQLAPKFPFVFISVLTVIVLFAALVFAQPDKLIADYNTDRYIDGSLETVDISLLSSLKYNAVPAMVRLVKHMDEQNGTDYREYYKDRHDSAYTGVYSSNYRHLCNSLEYMAHNCDTDVWSYTLVRERAEKAFSEMGLLIFEYED